MSDLLDTIQNLWVFVFIGILVWLYFREPSDQGDAPDGGARSEGEKRSDGGR